jgi:hypothetical protein
MDVTASVASAALSAKRSVVFFSNLVSSQLRAKPDPMSTGIPVKTTTRPSFQPKAIAKALDAVMLVMQTRMTKMFCVNRSSIAAGTEDKRDVRAPEACSGTSKKS